MTMNFKCGFFQFFGAKVELFYNRIYIGLKNTYNSKKTTQGEGY